MQQEPFKDFLRNTYKGGGQLSEDTIKSRIANCARVERYEGNLDLHFERDGLNDLLARLEYTTDDARAHRPPRHRVPIRGDMRNGSATLKSAITLYESFRHFQAGGGAVAVAPRRAAAAAAPQAAVPANPAKALSWPVWSEPSSQDVLTLARIVARHARFLHPEIVAAIVQDNEKSRTAWSDALRARGVDPSAYLWPGSACAFPGVRRYAGSREIAIFRKHAEGTIDDALALDDNDYPKQVWSFALTGRPFAKHGPQGYALAHLADHKNHNNRARQDSNVVEEQPETALHGLYTSAANSAYLPVALIRPTDFNAQLRQLLLRRANDLYGSVCRLLPPWLAIPSDVSDDWDTGRFAWPEPVGNLTQIESFLQFRHRRLDELLKAKPAQGQGDSDKSP